MGRLNRRVSEVLGDSRVEAHMSYRNLSDDDPFDVCWVLIAHRRSRKSVETIFQSFIHVVTI